MVIKGLVELKVVICVKLIKLKVQKIWMILEANAKYVSK